MKVKVSEVKDKALNWLVAKCEAQRNEPNDPDWLAWLVPAPSMLKRYCPSTDWSQGGPLIEREHICLAHDCLADETGWCAFSLEPISYGPTPLIAAMRCYVVNNLGNEVEVPEELT